jgi:hypothetical protein
MFAPSPHRRKHANALTPRLPHPMRPSGQSRRGPGFRLRVNWAVPLERAFGSPLSSKAGVCREVV